MAVSFTSIKKDIEVKIDSCEIKYNHVDKWLEEVERNHRDIVEENNKQNLDIVKMMTKLSNIESMLLEIKQKL